MEQSSVRFGVGLVALVMQSLAACTQPAAPAPPPPPAGRTQRIAFVSNRDGNFEIYVMNADGSGQKHLSDGSHPVWSPK